MILAALLLAGSPILASGPETPDRVAVPGGTVAFQRLLGGVATAPESFIASLGEVLLNAIDPNHEWKRIEDRRVADSFLEQVERTEERFGRQIELASEPKSLRKRFDDLAESFGYSVRLRKGRLEVVPAEATDQAERRRFADALTWDFPAVAERLNAGDRLTLTLPIDHVPSPLPFREWGALADSPIGETNALRAFVTDQRSGLVIAGLERVSPQTAAALRSMGLLRPLREKAAMPFYRYSSALRLVDRVWLSPGGSDALWTSLVGEPPSQPADFLLALLTRRGGRVAFLWHALAMAPPAQVQFYLGGTSADGNEDKRYIRRVLRRLDDTTRTSFDAPRGGDLGFGMLVRAVPLAESGTRLALPGGPGLWWSAIRGEESPDDLAALARVAQRGSETELDDGELILRVLSEELDVGGFERAALPRLTRVANLAGRDEALLTPENVVLLARATDQYPQALAVLDELVLSKPETIRDYLLAVHTVARLPRSIESERAILQFQGGVEMLRRLALAGNVGAETLESLLSRWSRLYLTASPRRRTLDQLRWLSQLSAELPAATADAPGRAPAERALFAALAVQRDPQRFALGGLEYSGARGLSFRRSLAEQLTRQQVPSLDSLVQIEAACQRLIAACLAADDPQVRRELATLEEIVRALPGAEVALAKNDGAFQERFGAPRRAEFLEALERVAKVKKAKKLPAEAGTVEAAIEQLAQDLRSFLLLSAYVGPLGQRDALLFDDPDLLRKHRAWESVERDDPTDSPWVFTRFDPGRDTPAGPHVAGGLPGVATAVGGQILLNRARGAGQHAGNLELLKRAYQDLEETRWGSLKPAATGLIAAAIAVGREVVAAAVAENSNTGPRTTFVAARIPYARLAREALRAERDPSAFGRSELLAIGLAAVEGDAFGPGLPELATAAVADFRHQQRALGASWRSTIDRAGVPSPSLTGKTRRELGWVPPYEAVEREGRLDAQFEHQALDLKLAVIEYLGVREFPGEIGADILSRILLRASAAQLATVRDWTSWLAWTNELTPTTLDEVLRECFRDGLYSLADS